MIETEGGGTYSAIRLTAIEVLEYVLKLEMTPARWEKIAGIIEITIDAEAAGDLDGLQHATIELELAGPIRIRIGETPTMPPSPELRERINHLIHALQGVQAAAETGGYQRLQTVLAEPAG